jgi:hypothetical protein
MDDLKVIKANNADTHQRQRKDLHCTNASRKVLGVVNNPHRSLPVDLYASDSWEEFNQWDYLNE